MPALLLALLLAAQDRSGPLPPDEALKGIRVPEGWTVELAAAEPDVIDPVAMAFDERGRIYVAEMRDYPSGPAAGTVRLLEDRDGDGRFEKATLFAGRLPHPTSVLPWRGGVLVTVAYEVLFLKDTDGDGVADERRTVLAGFGRQNTQHLLNGLQFGLDSWVWASNGLSGGLVNGVKLGGTDFRFRPDTGEVEPVSGNSQFGNAFDEWGRRFIVRHDNHIVHPVLPIRYLRREPALAVPAVEEAISDHGYIPKLHPVSARDKVFTTDTDSSCGITIYRGSAFVCEPVLNLVHQDALVPKGASFTARRALDGREFFASTDSWSRPVNLCAGPDGALYVVDMQRAVIEHPDYIPKDIQKKLDLKAGTAAGRIWRLRQGPRLPMPRLDAIETLAHEVPWCRTTAQRLLIERGAKDAAPALRELARGASVFGRLHALWTMEGLGVLEDADVARAMSDGEPGIREHAVRLAESRPGLKDAVAARASDDDARVRFQAALSGAPLAEIARRDAADPWTRAAILTSVGDGAVDLLAQVDDPELIRQLAHLVGRRNKGDEPLRWLATLNGAHARRSAMAIFDVLAPTPELLRSAQVEGRVEAWKAEALKRALGGAGGRVEAIEFLAPFRETSESLLPLLQPREPQEVQLAVVRRHGDALGGKLLAGWKAYTVPVRTAVVDLQLRRPERVAALLDLVERGEVRPNEIAPHHRASLLRHPDGRAKKLLEVKGSEDREEAIRAVATKIEPLAGDRARGEKVFTGSCMTCHRLQGKGTKVGPDLEGAIGRDRRALLADLLDPSRAMDPSYQVYVVKTASGELLDGVVSAETPSSLTLRRAGGEEKTVQRSAIAELKAWPASMMPEGLELSLTGQDFADLLEFLSPKR